MPKPMAADREDNVLDLVCTSLSQGERKLQVVDRPDRRPPSAVPPVDAIIRVINGDHDEEWAADVCLASKKFDPRLPPAMKELEAALTPPLTQLATLANRVLWISCCAHVRPDRVPSKEWRALMNEYYINIYDRAVIALARPNGEWTDSEVGIRWFEHGLEANEKRVVLSYRHPFLHESFAFSPKVRLKLTGQLRRARDAGYRTLLILDQESPAYMPWISNIVPTPYEIGEGIAFAVAHCRTTLDAGVLVDDSTVHEVYGRVGETTQSLARQASKAPYLSRTDQTPA